MKLNYRIYPAASTGVCEHNLLLGAAEGSLRICIWTTPGYEQTLDKLYPERIPFHDDILEEACMQLDEYFGGERTVFDLPLYFNLSVFQHSVLRACSAVPYGATVTYAELAARTGNIKAARAAGTALANNPFQIFIPCHRVTNANGTGSYAGGESTKVALIRMENKKIDTTTQACLKQHTR